MGVLNGLSNKISFSIKYKLDYSPELFQTPAISHTLLSHDLEEPQKITFLHPGGIVSYAVLRPPSKKASQGVDANTKLPVVLHLHGAGVETDSDQVRHTFDEKPDLRGWLLYPSGVTSWCGDDWRKCVS